MTQILKPDQTVRTRSGQACKVKQLIGAGGQGEVYRAEWNGQDFALKWYYAHTATAAQQASLERLVSVHKAPCDKFLWPLDLASSDTAPGFGYVMKLRESRYRGLLDLMLNRIDPTFAAVVHASFELVDSFFKLHADGLCYRDISFGNVFFDPHVGAVLICDNDNVTENNSPVTGILGTPDFMAPEIVRGEALPSRQTDLFSLAVLLFYLLSVPCEPSVAGPPSAGDSLLGSPCAAQAVWDRATLHLRPARSGERGRRHRCRSVGRSRSQRPRLLADLSTALA